MLSIRGPKRSVKGFEAVQVKPHDIDLELGGNQKFVEGYQRRVVMKVRKESIDWFACILPDPTPTHPPKIISNTVITQISP
jgi:hypothetical protein